jgi:alpha-1,3-mannosyl-glycoprotein beta-1,2-N-acetylglucosaminyltransferase
MQDNYDVQFVKQVYESLVVTYQELKSDSIVSEGSVRIPYHTNDIYKRTAKLLGLMDDFRVSSSLAVEFTVMVFNVKCYATSCHACLLCS